MILCNEGGSGNKVHPNTQLIDYVVDQFREFCQSWSNHLIVECWALLSTSSGQLVTSNFAQWDRRATLQLSTFRLTASASWNTVPTPDKLGIHTTRITNLLVSSYVTTGCLRSETRDSQLVTLTQPLACNMHASCPYKRVLITVTWPPTHIFIHDFARLLSTSKASSISRSAIPCGLDTCTEYAQTSMFLL